MTTEREPERGFYGAAGRLPRSPVRPRKTSGSRPLLFDLIQLLDSEFDKFDSGRNAVCRRWS